MIPRIEFHHTMMAYARYGVQGVLPPVVVDGVKLDDRSAGGAPDDQESPGDTGQPVLEVARIQKGLDEFERRTGTGRVP